MPEKSGPGPDGVAVSGGVVYGDTSATVFALSARTGKVIWVDKHLLNSGQGAFEIQPQVTNNKVYVASAYGTGPGGGVLFALNASNGQPAWRFSTLTGADVGVHASKIGSGGAWETPLVGADGSVTFGVGNPYQSAASAIAHPAAQLYTDSDVNLDAATGKLRWYYQGVSDDFMDHDMQSSPIAATIDGAPAVIGSGKLGVVDAMNARTGKLIWKTPVGEHSQSDKYPAEALARTLSAQGAVHDPARLAGRRAVQPGRGRKHGVRGHHQPAVPAAQAGLPAGGAGRQRHRAGRGPEPQHRQGGMGHQGRGPCRWAPPRCPTTWSSPRCTAAS